MWLKSYCRNNKDPTILQRQYQGCWWPGIVGIQGISRYGTYFDLIFTEYFIAHAGRVSSFNFFPCWIALRNLTRLLISHDKSGYEAIIGCWNSSSGNLKNLPLFCCQYHCCWWPDDTGSQGISRHGIAIIYWEHAVACMERVNIWTQNSQDHVAVLPPLKDVPVIHLG